MNNELIERIDARNRKEHTRSSRVADIELMKILQDCKAALAQQQESEPVAWISRVKCVGPEYGKERYGKLPVQSLNPLYYEHVPLYLHPPKPAAQPQVPEEWKESLQELISAMYNYEMIVDEEAPAKHRMMMRKAEALLSAAKEEGK